MDIHEVLGKAYTPRIRHMRHMRHIVAILCDACGACQLFLKETVHDSI